MRFCKYGVSVFSVLFFFAGCTSTNPAGFALYENPPYASEMKGFFYCGQGPYSAVFSPGSSVVWISEPANSRIWYKDVSEAVVNPLICDTLLLDFSPGLMISPPEGNEIFVCSYYSSDVYSINTETLMWNKVYTCSSSIVTMQLSSDGGTMYLGSLGTPWHVEAVSTTSWIQTASVSADWPVLRLELSPDDSLIAVGNSGRTGIYLFDAVDLSPVDTLITPMRTGTMAFTSDSRSLVVLDAASNRPYMIKIDLETGEEEFRSRPYNSYLVSSRIPGANTLILPRDQDEGVSVLNMDNMIFAPSIPLNSRSRAVCVSSDGGYIVTVSRTSTPGRATVFIKGE
ncbi:MAG: WD40 repeat domain-containing protein [Candidatus Sabulitectum sp.]|nr:WD40 repeat domain-containing protein [Candidatus Sabulitectum sp.]